MAHQSKSNRSQQIGLAAFFAPEIRAWRGEAGLAAVFWLHGVLISAVLITLFASSIYRGEVLLEQGSLIGFGLYTAWVLVSIWRCSLAADPFWGVVAKVLSVFRAANSELVVFFLQLELVIHYVGK